MKPPYKNPYFTRVLLDTWGSASYSAAIEMAVGLNPALFPLTRNARENQMTTYSAKAKDIVKNWVLIDAEGLVVGRAAAIIANRLRGKHKPTFTPHMDCGDHVVVINAEKIHFTGKKREQKSYYHHTGFPGGIKERNAGKILDGKFPDRILELAVKRMLPGGPLKRQQMTCLCICTVTVHPHEAQNPAPLDIRAMNPKNAVRG